jgi:three-Cys-motif partner protein
MDQAGQPDEVGKWTRIKHEILVKYASAYTTILTSQPSLRFYYIDAFAGEGENRIKGTDKQIAGSPLRVLELEPKFNAYCFIEKSPEKAEALREKVKGNSNVKIICDDANEVLCKEILPKITYDSYQRALLFLDPFALNVYWPLMELAGGLETVDVFLNFMTMDMNRNVLRHDKNKVSVTQLENFDQVMGDTDWQKIAFSKNQNLFEEEIETRKSTSSAVLDYYRNRLHKVAGFKYVPRPVPIRNDQGAIVYHLFFASHYKPANDVASWVFKKSQEWRVNDV